MNAKFALALILTLQVSMSFCEAHDPPQDLVDRYNEIKEKLYKRGENLFQRFMAVVESSEQAQVVRGQLEGLPANPKAVAARQVADAIRKEFEPLLEQARHAGLGFYNDNLREHLRPVMETVIAYISNVLDQYVPAE